MIYMNQQRAIKNLTEEEFNQDSKFYGFFNLLDKYFKKQLKFNDKKTKTFIQVCSNIHEGNFDPWKLNSQEYLNDFKSWYKVNASASTYLESIKSSVKNIVKFCKQKKITKIEDYVTNWGVTHYISGVLNDNVAYIIGLHELQLTKPEKFMIKRFLKNLPIIKERIEREKQLEYVLKKEIDDAKKMLSWI